MFVSRAADDTMIDITRLARVGAASQILVLHFHFREILLKRKLGETFLRALGLWQEHATTIMLR